MRCSGNGPSCKLISYTCSKIGAAQKVQNYFEGGRSLLIFVECMIKSLMTEEINSPNLVSLFECRCEGEGVWRWKMHERLLKINQRFITRRELVCGTGEGILC